MAVEATNWRTGVYALTGSLGSGKSTVSDLLRREGAFVVSADELARTAVERDSPALQEIVARFGSGILTSDGTLDRKRLGKEVFEDPRKRKELEEILHPRIAELAHAAFTTTDANRAHVRIYDCPLLFETGLDQKGFRKIILVAAPEAECLARVMKRDQLSEAEVRARFSAQLPITEKIPRSEIVLHNTGTVAELEEKVHVLYAELEGAAANPNASKTPSHR